MILIDSVYVNNSGGKVLLDYLVQELEENGLKPFYLFDERCRDSFATVPESRKKYVKASLLKRNLFYRKNKDVFTRVLCFGNIPPSVRLKATVLTYLHQPLYFDRPADIGLKKRVALQLKESIIKFFIGNTQYWAVQSDNLVQLMTNRWGIDKQYVKVWPFYPPLDSNSAIERKQNRYLFVSGGNSHKNQFRLIEAFSSFSEQYPDAELHLTVSEKFPEVRDLIKLKVEQGIKIVNHGFVPRQQLADLYKSSRFLIYPSLAESFGLGLMEAINLGCDVIASDLPYVHAVCKPSLVFEPLDTSSITDALHKSQTTSLPSSKIIANNEINNILSFLNV